MKHSNLREQRILDRPLMTFDLQYLMGKLRNEEVWEKSGRNSITLTMGRGLRVLLIVLKKGGVLEKHTANHAIGLQVLEGEIEFSADEEGPVNLKENGLVILKEGVSHSVKARRESAFLLILGA